MLIWRVFSPQYNQNKNTILDEYNSFVLYSANLAIFSCNIHSFFQVLMSLISFQWPMIICNTTYISTIFVGRAIFFYGITVMDTDTIFKWTCIKCNLSSRLDIEENLPVLLFGQPKHIAKISKHSTTTDTSFLF